MNFLKTHGLLILTATLITMAIASSVEIIGADEKRKSQVAILQAFCAERGGVLLTASDNTNLCLHKDAIISLEGDSK